MDAQTDANVTKPGATMYVDPSIHFNTARIVTRSPIEHFQHFSTVEGLVVFKLCSFLLSQTS